MDRYQQNAKWLQYISPFQALALSAAYLTPFFLEKGLTLSGILALQSIYSIAVVGFEIPGGYVADRIGRVMCIRGGLLMTSLAIVAYALCDTYWQFVVCEVVLAAAKSLISGVDDALLVDSLKASRPDDDDASLDRLYTRTGQRIDAFGYLGIAVGVPLSIVMVRSMGVSAVILADGLLTLVGALFAWKLFEAPRSNGSEEDKRRAVFRASGRLIGNVQARWLVLLGAALTTSTYLAFWLAPAYFEGMGISAVWFGAILAVRSGIKALLALCCRQERHLERNLFVYASLAGLVYLAMASGQPWLLPMIIGHDVIQALHRRPVQAALRQHMHAEYRATLKSMVNLVERLLIFAASLAAAGIIAVSSLQAGFVAIGVAGSALALLALVRLHSYATFQQRR